MTALAFITMPEGVIVASDGGNYLSDGTLDGVAGKVIMLPEASAVITGRGSCIAHVVAMQEAALTSERLSLDRLVDMAPGHVDRVTVAIRAATGEAEPLFSVYFAGWSEARQAGEAWGIASYDTALASARVVHRLPECFITPELPQHVADHFGLRMPSTGETQWREAPESYAVRAICAARFCPCAPPDDRIAAVARGAASCFVQKTIVMRGTVHSAIMHEWPDVVGETIDTTRGLPFPGASWQTEEPTHDERPARDPMPGERSGKRARRRHR